MRVRTYLRDAARFVAYGTGLRTADDVYRWPSDTWDTDWQSGVWDYMADPAEAPRYAIIAGLVLAEEPGSVLDVGCGIGNLRRHLPTDGFTTYHGVDVAPHAIARATRASYPDSTFACADAETDAIEPADTVVLNEVAYLVADPARFVTDVPRLVRPGGRVIASIYRHPGDVVHWRALGRLGPETERVWVRNRNPSAPYGTRISVYRLP